MVGIQGADITDGSVTLTKALVWQLMRDHLLRTLRSTSPKIKDADMLAWANEKVVDQKISSFGDPLLKNGAFLISLLRALDPSIEPIKVLSYDSDEAELLNNARYILSVARRMGAALFLLPEDIVECKAKMIMTFVASLMALQRSI
ncbi:fimbrin [Mitosporidium daphniae]